MPEYTAYVYYAHITPIIRPVGEIIILDNFFISPQKCSQNVLKSRARLLQCDYNTHFFTRHMIRSFGV